MNRLSTDLEDENYDYDRWNKINTESFKSVPELTNLQNLLLNISDDNFDEVRKAAIPFCENITSVFQLLKSIRNLINFYPLLYDHYLKLLQTLEKELKNIFNTQLYKRRFCTTFKPNIRMINIFVELNIIDLDLIMDDSLFSNITYLRYKQYYYPEIVNKNPSYFQKIEDMEDFIQKYNYSEFIEKRKKGINDVPICQAIINDDLEKFLEFATPDLDLNSNTPYSIFELSEIVTTFDRFEMKFIEYAAFYGSVKIFKYMLENNVSVTPLTLKAAILGGNKEVIALADEAKGEGFEMNMKVPGYAVQSFRKDVFDLLMKKYGFPMSDDVVMLGTTYYNLEAVVEGTNFLTQNGKKPESNTLTVLNPCLHEALRNDHYEIFSYFLSFDGYYDINYKYYTNNNMTLLHLACLGHKIPAAILLLKKRGIITNLEDKRFRTPEEYLAPDERNFIKSLFVQAKFHEDDDLL